jgi:hypothetical protein
VQQIHKTELSYKLSKSGSGHDWIWELLSPDSKVLGRGAADTNVRARAQAMAEAINQISALERPTRE